MTASVETQPSTETAPSPRRRPPRPQASGSTGLLLGVCCVAQFMVILDLSIVNVALPSIQSSLKFSASDLQWVVDAYAIVFAGFLMLAGRAGDLWGQRRTFVAALTLFSLASLAGGLAPTSGVLIGARAFQGFAGALMAASSLAIITASFEAGPARHRAVGLWGAMNGAGGAAGTLAGGVITQALSWRWVLLINLPIGLVAAVVASAVVVDRRSDKRTSFDLAGALLLTVGLLLNAYGAVTAGSYGWGSRRRWSRSPSVRAAQLVPGGRRSDAQGAARAAGAFTRPLRNVNVIVLLFSAALFPMWYIGSLYLQQVLALLPMETGLVFLPMALMIFACASQAGKLVYARRAPGARRRADHDDRRDAAVHADRRQRQRGAVRDPARRAHRAWASASRSSRRRSPPPRRAEQGQAGLASGLVNTSRQVGGGLGLAVLISIATLYTSHLIGAQHSVCIRR